MSRLDQIVEQLFTRPGATLVLESDTPGAIEQPGVGTVPAFRQSLRTGQILLLFADVVPRELSSAFLAGHPTEFPYKTKNGVAQVAMKLDGQHLRVRIAAMGVPSVQHASSPTPVPQPSPGALALAKLIEDLPARGATHLHVAPLSPPFARVAGQLVPMADLGSWRSDAIREAAVALAPRGVKESVRRAAHFEFTAMLSQALVHVRGDESHEGLQLVARHLPKRVASIVELGVPRDVSNGVEKGGLWVFASAVSGASTTMLAVTQHLLDSKPRSVVTAEAPLQGMLAKGSGLVRQLEVGSQVPSYTAALDFARQSDADVIAIADLTQPDVVAAALFLAASGRTVLGVVPAGSTAAAIARLLGALPRSSHAQLAQVLAGVVAQRPCRPQGPTAWELTLRSDRLAALVRENATGRLEEACTQSMDMGLVSLVRTGALEPREAIELAADAMWVESRLQRRAA